MVKFVVIFRWNLKRNIKQKFANFSPQTSPDTYTTSLRKFTGKTSPTIFRQLSASDKVGTYMNMPG